jgi:hypothetical protein
VANSFRDRLPFKTVAGLTLSLVSLQVKPVIPTRNAAGIRIRGTRQMAHTQPGLDHRHRDANGEIGRKHGNTLISTLRETYGASFAPGQPGHMRLSQLLHVMDEPSLSRLCHRCNPSGR